MKNKTFTYEYDSEAAHLAASGSVEWDSDKKKWKAIIIAQRNPEIRFEACDHEPQIAGIRCCAKWMGVERDRDREALESLHDWMMQKAPEHYKGCGLWIDVEILLGRKCAEDFDDDSENTDYEE